MAGYTAEEVLDLVIGENNHLDSEDDIDIEEDPSFSLPHESSSEDEESGNETEGKQHQIIDIHSTASSFYELQKYLQKTTKIEFTLMNL